MQAFEKPVTVGFVSDCGIVHEFKCDSITFNEDYDMFTNSSEFTLNASVNYNHPIIKGFRGALSDRQEWEMEKPKKVVYSNGHTIVTWQDGTITKTHTHDGDEFDPRIGFFVCAMKRFFPAFTYFWNFDREFPYVEADYGKKKKSKFPETERKPSRHYQSGQAYGEDEKQDAIDLVNSGISQQEVARSLGIAQSTISRWMSEFRDRHGE